MKSYALTDAYSLEKFENCIRKDHIRMIKPTAAACLEGETFYIDHRNGSIFGHRELGLRYSHESLQERFLQPENLAMKLKIEQEEKREKQRSLRI